MYAFLRDYCKDGCIICGELNYVCLDFDHREQSEKEFGISNMVRDRYSLDRIKEELKKCDVLCANCHRKKTAKQLGWYAVVG